MPSTAIFTVHSFMPHVTLEIRADCLTHVCGMLGGLSCPQTANTGPGIITHNISRVCMHLCNIGAYGVLVFDPSNNVYYPYGQARFIEAVCQAVDRGLAMVDPKA